MGFTRKNKKNKFKLTNQPEQPTPSNPPIGNFALPTSEENPFAAAPGTEKSLYPEKNPFAAVPDTEKPLDPSDVSKSPLFKLKGKEPEYEEKKSVEVQEAINAIKKERKNVWEKIDRLKVLVEQDSNLDNDTINDAYDTIYEALNSKRCDAKDERFIPTFEFLVEKEHKKAPYALASLYKLSHETIAYTGIKDLRQDFKKAIELYKLAGDLGNPNGYYSLGDLHKELYEEEKEWPYSHQESFKYYNMAYNMAYNQAQEATKKAEEAAADKAEEKEWPYSHQESFKYYKAKEEEEAANKVANKALNALEGIIKEGLKKNNSNSKYIEIDYPYYFKSIFNDFEPQRDKDLLKLLLEHMVKNEKLSKEDKINCLDQIDSFLSLQKKDDKQYEQFIQTLSEKWNELKGNYKENDYNLYLVARMLTFSIKQHNSKNTNTLENEFKEEPFADPKIENHLQSFEPQYKIHPVFGNRKKVNTKVNITTLSPFVVEHIHKDNTQLPFEGKGLFDINVMRIIFQFSNLMTQTFITDFLNSPENINFKKVVEEDLKIINEQNLTRKDKNCKRSLPGSGYEGEQNPPNPMIMNPIVSVLYDFGIKQIS